MTYQFDVVIAGGGNAGLCSALAANEAGARVMLVDWAPESRFGGNSFYTGGGIRFAHTGTADVLSLVPEAGLTEDSIHIESYTEPDFYTDLLSATEYRADPTLAEALIGRSRETLSWMQRNGVKFELRFAKHSMRVGERTIFFGGLVLEAFDGGQGLVTGLLKTVRQRGVEVVFNCRLIGAELDETGAISRVQLRSQASNTNINTSSLILASGGFEANAAMRAQYLGKNWDLARPRGTEFNQGDGHRIGVALGAGVAGHWTGCHAVQWDLNAPAIRDRRIAHGYERESYPLGIVVNRSGRRFLDEGANFFPLTYAKYGKEVLKQPGAVAFQIFDSKVADLLLPEYSLKSTTLFRRDNLSALAQVAEIDARGLIETVERFNAGVSDAEFNHMLLDGKLSKSDVPQKSNWSQPIDSPPFLAFPVTCGITFTFGGLHIDHSARVLDPAGQAIPGLFAAGEMAGGIFYHNYPGGSGLLSGAVFGRAAGYAAAELRR